MSNLDGIVPVTLDGAAYTIKPTWRAISDIEGELGVGIVLLFVKLSRRDFGLREIVTIILHGLKACHRDGPMPTYDAVAEKVFKTGVLSPALIDAVLLFCEYALNGGQPSGEEPAASTNA